MLQVQYDLFLSEEECEIRALKKRIEEIGESANKVRKGIYARHGELYKFIVDVDNRLQVIEQHICRKP